MSIHDPGPTIAEIRARIDAFVAKRDRIEQEERDERIARIKGYAEAMPGEPYVQRARVHWWNGGRNSFCGLHMTELPSAQIAFNIAEVNCHKCIYWGTKKKETT